MLLKVTKVVLMPAQVVWHLWELPGWFDAQEAVRVGTKTRLDQFIVKNEHTWKKMHERLFPGMAVPCVVANGRAHGGRKMRGPGELAMHTDEFAAPSSLFLAIQVWAISGNTRAWEHRVTSAETLAKFLTMFMKHPKLQRPDMLGFPVTGLAGSVHVQVDRNGIIKNITQILDWRSCDSSVQSVAQLWQSCIEAKASVEMRWVETHMLQPSLGEFIALSLLQAKISSPLWVVACVLVKLVFGILESQGISKVFDACTEEVCEHLKTAPKKRRLDTDVKVHILELSKDKAKPNRERPHNDNNVEANMLNI